MSVAIYRDILSATLQSGANYNWPGLCQNLESKYDGLSPDFRFFNACTIYPNLVQGLASGDFNNDQSFIDELSGYGIKTIANVPQVSEDITTWTTEFLVASCGNIECNNDLSRGRNWSCDATLLKADNGQSLSLDSVYSCMAAMCTNLEPYVKDDPDIGGVGVFISYILQILLVLLMTIYVLFKFIMHERRVIPSDIHSPFAGSIAFPEALQEFQKLQSWFIGSLVIAAFIRQYQEITNISVTDFLFLGGISLNGIVLICYMNCALLLLGRKSWYVYGLSCITFSMCSAFIIYANVKRVERVDHVLPALLFCEKQLAYLEYSDEITKWVRLVSQLPQSVIYIAWAFCAAVQLSCLFWMMELDKRLSRGFKDWLEGRAGQIVMWIVVILILLCFLAIFGLQMVMLYNFWGIVDPNQWSFGQIIAVTIWLPLVIDYFHSRYKEKKAAANLQQYPKDEEAGYSVIPYAPGPSKNGSGNPQVTALGGQPVPPLASSSASQLPYGPSQQQGQLAPSTSAYAYPTPQIRIDTQQPAVSPATAAAQAHFASPLLPSMPTSPMFPVNPSQASALPGSGVPGAGGAAPTSATSRGSEGPSPSDGHGLHGHQYQRQSGTSFGSGGF
ncbi:hypothetical protein DRE_00142 [Drechslerella stenobrocha 248]|uniref:Uncharacterized protein n=1 Tax=Drechslerella stenobrocha 248 TaxID=1043628 RepID=W7I9R0_9PEZI|nr:hypothetical protein DRE_00142 [Drechslerella stenobrocha 248]